jgi:hypothetical protein
MNTLFNIFNKNSFQNTSNILNQMNQIKQQLNGNSPQQFAQNLLNSGKVSQDYYNQKYQQALQMWQMLGK